MRIKQKPEDFSVKESYRFEEVPGGRYRVYLMDKQKLSTFDAADRIRTAFGLKPGSISYCGLKDKQGRTEQLIAVDGADVDMQEQDLRLKYLGRTDRPLSAANITSNRFAVTVRALDEADLGPLNVAAAEVNRLGVVNYFDSQRFGSLKHGQGFIAKDLIRGDFEAALRNYFAKPSELDRSEDAKVKAFWRENWGRWNARVPFEGSKKYHRVLRSLRDHPDDYVRAFLQIESDYRAMLLFTYQSYLWNEGVRRYLQLLLPRESLFPMQYQAGTLLFHRAASAEVLHTLRDATFPLLGPETPFSDPKVEEAVHWVLKREKITLADLRIEEAPKMLFFKHEERPVLSFPHKLVLGKPRPDEVNRGDTKVNIAFTLPPGAYATLVVKRLFHFSWREDTREEIFASQRPRLSEALEKEAAVETRRAPPRQGQGKPEAPRRPAAAPAKAEAPARPPGFREAQRLKKEGRARARAEAPPAKHAKSQKKK
ncbi:tRNA pseudouridine(13) synthase TruD [Myxococcaceae bacterium GXIMD 01537]